jgi:hypothetical protein
MFFRMGRAETASMRKLKSSFKNWYTAAGHFFFVELGALDPVIKG